MRPGRHSWPTYTDGRRGLLSSSARARLEAGARAINGLCRGSTGVAASCERAVRANYCLKLRCAPSGFTKVGKIDSFAVEDFNLVLKRFNINFANLHEYQFFMVFQM